MFYRDSWIEINIDNLKANVLSLKNTTKKEFIAVIKANGYGNGDAIIAKSLIECGVNILAVSSLDEALALRKAKIDVDILILGYVNPQYIELCIENNIIVTLISTTWLDKVVMQKCKGLKVHIKIDTGMNRLGLKNLQQARYCLDKMIVNNIDVQGIYTHLASSDNIDRIMCDKQFSQFRNLVDALDYEFNLIHMANSDAAINYNENYTNAIRCGIAMFGISSYETDLLPVMSLYSKVVHIKQIKQGETVGYGETYCSKANEYVATIPIGYADGWIRKHQGRNVIVNNKQCEIIGRVCMDQMMIKLDEMVEVGSIVELIGPNISLKLVADQLDTIPYEVMTLLSDRLAKVYKENKEIIMVTNPRLERLF